MTTYFGGTENAARRLEMPAVGAGLQASLKETSAKLKVEQWFNLEWNWNDGAGAVAFLQERGARWIWKDNQGYWLI